jgi:phosphoribosylamine--glycine ligase
MGSISPVPFTDAEFMEKIEERIIKPTIQGLQSDGILYRGFIFFGLMNVDGDPYVIEYNARMGDPEAESIMPRIKSDLLELFVAVGEEKLNTKTIEFDPRYSVAVIAASGGYPGSYVKGKEITGTDKTEDVLVFFAGSNLDPESQKIHTSGGRVLAVTGMAETLGSALEKTYREISKIDFDKMYYRKDLGRDLLGYSG